MKANGRRRWRKWSARSAQTYRRKARRDGYELHPDELRMPKGVYLKERKVCGILPLLPAREFSPRSLCGMTQGARKRAVWREFDAVSCPPGVESISDRMQWYLLRMPYLRAKYRLGERLRPCLVCQWAKCKLPCGDCSTCDGSGVLPAKRHRRCGWWLKTRTAMNATQRCGMPTADGWFDCQNCGGAGWLPAKRYRLEYGIDYSDGKDWSVRLTAECIGWNCQKCGTLINGDELELPTAVCLCGVGEGLWMRAHAALPARGE